MCKRLGIIELDYFGLQFTGPKGETLWLNTRNRIRRQISGTPPYRLQFRVKFFVQPQYLLQDSTRYNLKMVYEFVNRGNGLNHDSLYYFPLALSSTVVYLSCWVERCQLYTQMLPFFFFKGISIFSIWKTIWKKGKLSQIRKKRQRCMRWSHKQPLGTMAIPTLRVIIVRHQKLNHSGAQSFVAVFQRNMLSSKAFDRRQRSNFSSKNCLWWKIME